MGIINRVGGPAMHALLGRALGRMRAEGVADTHDPADVVACIKRNFKAAVKSLEIFTIFRFVHVHACTAKRKQKMGLVQSVFA